MLFPAVQRLVSKPLDMHHEHTREAPYAVLDDVGDTLSFTLLTGLLDDLVL